MFNEITPAASRRVLPRNGIKRSISEALVTSTMNCLITGGAGFIGCAISAQMADAFTQVVAIDNLHPQVHKDRVRPMALDERVSLQIDDVCDERAWDRLLGQFKPDVVIHLAAETGTGQSLTEGSRHAHVNCVGLTTMLDCFVRNDAVPERIVLSSSRAVYGEGGWIDATGQLSYPGQRTKEMLEAGVWDFPGKTAVPFDSTILAPMPTSIYGATKLAQEHILSCWGQALGTETPILRLQNVYGPGQSLTNPYTGIVPFFAGLARSGKPIPIYEDGAIVRDFVFITDVAAAISRVAIGGSPTIVPYDVGTSQPTTILELATLIASIYDAPVPEINGKFRHGDVRSACCKIDRTTRELGWVPMVMLAEGVGSLCHWIDSQQR